MCIKKKCNSQRDGTVNNSNAVNTDYISDNNGHVSFSLQGHNQIVAYSRAAYFCIFCGLIWILELILKKSDLPVSRVYGMNIVVSDTLRFVRDILVGEYVQVKSSSYFMLVLLSPQFHTC